MKQLFLSLVLALMSVMVSMPSSASTGKNVDGNEPENIIVKQTTHFNDGRTLVIYYKKLGEQCEIYSTSDLNAYTKVDLKKVQSTNFEMVDKVAGKLYKKTTMDEVMGVLKQIVNRK
ncbi:MAG: hypothetical protein IKR05_11665 [Prevotella sp.]|nr:hypothetical protein [Prevotella sp.]MBR6263857.1 hypothetical protein [Prevotella sp.]